jgi:beta-fructofuranosidase
VRLLKEAESKEFRGCIGIAVAEKITGPYELLPPAALPFVEGTKESIHREMERPQVIYKDGKYHLFFSCWTYTLNPKWIQKVGSEKITNSSLYWYVSDKVTGSFKPVNEKPIVRGSNKTGLYGTNFIESMDQSGEFIAYGWYKKMSKLEVSPQFRVSWNNNSIEIM